MQVNVHYIHLGLNDILWQKTINICLLYIYVINTRFELSYDKLLNTSKIWWCTNLLVKRLLLLILCSQEYIYVGLFHRSRGYGERWGGGAASLSSNLHPTVGSKGGFWRSLYLLWFWDRGIRQLKLKIPCYFLDTSCVAINLKRFKCVLHKSEVIPLRFFFF